MSKNCLKGDGRAANVDQPVAGEETLAAKVRRNK